MSRHRRRRGKSRFRPVSTKHEMGRVLGDEGVVDGGYRFGFRPLRSELHVIASAGYGWDHVSVSLPDRTPTWEEMDFVKSIFWPDNVTVMQLHPPRSRYVNDHPHCLHMWVPHGERIPLPPIWMVGNLSGEPS